MGTLSDARVIEKVSRHFIPVAVNLYKVREQKDPAGDFFRSAQKQKPQFQGMWFVAPDGKMLGGFMDFKSEATRTAELLDAIDAALAKAEKAAPREVKVKEHLTRWGRGTRDDGEVSLAIHTRHVQRGRPVGNGAIDDVRYTAKDWEEFAPREPEKGKTWRISKGVASQLSPCLSVYSDKSNMPLPSEVTVADVTGQVARVKDGVATLTYSGVLAAVHRHPFQKERTNSARVRLRGYGLYDVEKKEMRELTWVFEGTYRTFQPYDKEEIPLVALAEWRR